MIGLRWLARSPRRLGVAALVALGVLFGASGPLGTHIRDVSASVAADMVVLTIWVVLLLFGAYCLAVLVGDRLFPHHWRRRVIVGEHVPPPEDEDPLLPPVILKSHVGGFSAILVVLIALASFGLDAATGGLFSYYQYSGHMRTIMRGSNTELKIELLGELSDVRRERFVREALLIVDMAWRDDRQPELVRRTALLSLGRLGHSLRTSMDAWARQGTRQHWERDLGRKLTTTVAPDLRRAFTSAPTSLRAPIAHALGKMRDGKSIDLLLAHASAEGVEDDEVLAACLSAVGMIREAPALGALVALAPKIHGTQAFRALAFSAGELARHYVPDTDKEVEAVFPALVETFARLGAKGDILQRCDAVDVLRKTGDARIAAPIFVLFDRDDSDGTCPAAYVDIGEPAPELMSPSEPYRLRLLKGLALVAVGNDEVLDWARARREEGQYGTFIHAQIRETLKMVDAKP